MYPRTYLNGVKRLQRRKTFDMASTWLEPNRELLRVDISSKQSFSDSIRTAPSAFKYAIFKKPQFDSSILSNFSPISHLLFLSKMFEKKSFNVLESNNIYGKFQSGFRLRHKTETTLLKTHNITMSNSKCPVILALLDLTAVFDKVDHQNTLLVSVALHWHGLLPLWQNILGGCEKVECQ